MNNNVLFLPDLHWGVRNDSILYRNLQVKFLRDILIPYVKTNDIRHIVSFGDLFDRRKYTNHLTLDIAKKEFFDVIYGMSIQLDIIIGNHDSFYTNTNELNTPELFLGEYENINVFYEPTEREIYGVKYLYLPWINSTNQQQSIELINTTNAKIILGHLEIQGFEMYEGSITNSNGFKPEIFKRFDAVISGHFHQPSTYSNIRYIGAIGHFTWSDYGSDRGCFVFNPHLGIENLEFIRNPFDPYVKVYYEESIDILDYDYSTLTGKIVKIIVTEKDDIDKFDLFVDMVRKANTESYKVIDNSIYHYFDSAIDEGIMSEDTVTFVNSYIEQSKIPDKSKVQDMFKEIYLEAVATVITE